MVVMLAACATQQQRVTWNKLGASQAEYDRDIAQCDYETSSATTTPDYGYRTLVGQELDRANRKNGLFTKCMTAKGWTASNY